MRADHLRDTAFVGLAGDEAVGALAALAIGAAAIARRALRERAAGLVADLLELGRAGLRQMNVAGPRHAAEGQGPAQDEQSD